MPSREELPDIVLKLLKIIEQLHGIPNWDDKPSESATQRMYLKLTSDPVSEDEVMSKIKADREGALSLFSVMLRKAGFGGYSVSSLSQLQSAKMPEIKLETKNLLTPLVVLFYNSAASEFLYMD